MDLDQNLCIQSLDFFRPACPGWTLLSEADGEETALTLPKTVGEHCCVTRTLQSGSWHLKNCTTFGNPLYLSLSFHIYTTLVLQVPNRLLDSWIRFQAAVCNDASCKPRQPSITAAVSRLPCTTGSGGHEKCHTWSNLGPLGLLTPAIQAAVIYLAYFPLYFIKQIMTNTFFNKVRAMSITIHLCVFKSWHHSAF